jgi:hypothetical protein
MNLTNGTFLSFYSNGNHTLTTGGKDLCAVSRWVSIYVRGKLTLQDDFVTANGFFDHNWGELDANDNDVTVSKITFQGSMAKTLTMGNGIWSLFLTTGNIFQSGSSVTLNAESSTIKLTSALTGNITISGGGYTFNNLWNATTNAYSLIISGSNTFNDFKIDAGRTVKFTNSTTTTVTTFTALGTSGSHITLSNTSSTTHATLAKAGGGVISGCDYIDASYLTGSPDLTWAIGSHSTDVGPTCTNIYLVDSFKTTYNVTAQSKARIKILSINKTVQVKADIFKSGVNKTIQSRARILKIETESVNAKAKISKAISKTIEAKARIENTNTKTIQVKADIKKSGVTRTTEFKGRIKKIGNDKTIQVKSRIKKLDNDKTVQEKARIKVINNSESVQAKARMLIMNNLTVEAKALVKVSGIGYDISARSRLKRTESKTITSMAKIIARSQYVPIGTIENTYTPEGKIKMFIPIGNTSKKLTVPSGR